MDTNDNILTGNLFPSGSSTVTSTFPLPAENVSTVKSACVPITVPVGSIPGPYTRTLRQTRNNKLKVAFNSLPLMRSNELFFKPSIII